MVSILFDFLSFEKSSATPYKSLKNFFEIGHAGYQKKQNFALISKMRRSLEFGKREKKFYRKTEFLSSWKVFTKYRFSKKNSLGTS
jgi:hypothetical protein